jgi:hypothetical protein
MPIEAVDCRNIAGGAGQIGSDTADRSYARNVDEIELGHVDHDHPACGMRHCMFELVDLREIEFASKLEYRVLSGSAERRAEATRIDQPSRASPPV